MENEKKKLDVTGIIGLVFSILSIICIIISFTSYAGIKIFNLPVESAFILMFSIIALSLAFVGIFLGFDGRRRWASGHSDDGNLTGTNAIVLGFVTAGCAALLFLMIELQGGFELLFKQKVDGPDRVQLEQLLKEKIYKTTEHINLILLHAKSYAKYMEEDSIVPSIEKLAAKYGFERKDAWGNDIIIKFSKKLDENESFLEWGADVSSAGPDGKAGTEDDIRPEK
jgi:hypothetical protein